MLIKHKVGKILDSITISSSPQCTKKEWKNRELDNILLESCCFNSEQEKLLGILVVRCLRRMLTSFSSSSSSVVSAEEHTGWGEGHHHSWYISCGFYIHTHTHTPFLLVLQRLRVILISNWLSFNIPCIYMLGCGMVTINIWTTSDRWVI